MAREYTDEATVERYMVLDIHSSYASQITQWIRAMSAVIDEVTGRTFQTVQGETASARYFDGNGSPIVNIDEALSISAIELGDALGANLSEITANVLMYPRVAPFRRLVLASGFTRGIQNVKVTGIWGHTATVPDDIKFVCTVLVAGIINASENKLGKKSEKIGNYAVTYTDDKGVSDYETAMKILEAHKTYHF